jgi:hypothetical protein
MEKKRRKRNIKQPEMDVSPRSLMLFQVVLAVQARQGMKCRHAVYPRGGIFHLPTMLFLLLLSSLHLD